MRRLTCTGLALLVTVTLACRKKSSEVGGMTDTTPSAAAAAPMSPDTAPTVREFGFDQRQEFAQSIRQQLAGIDQEIRQLADQAKSRGGAVSDRALANIRASRRAVDRSLQRVDAATAANWEQMKQAVNQSLDNLSESIEAAQPK